MRTEKNMKKDTIFPLVIGLVLGIIIMLFWQFNLKLNNQKAALLQMEQAVASNTKTVGDIVNFINNATAQKGNVPTTPTTPTTPTSDTNE